MRRIDVRWHGALTTIHNALSEDERTKTIREGTRNESEDTQRPASPDYQHAIMLPPPDHVSHNRATEIGYAGCHGPDDWYVRVTLELWKPGIVILKHTE